MLFLEVLSLPLPWATKGFGSRTGAELWELWLLWVWPRWCGCPEQEGRWVSGVWGLRQDQKPSYEGFLESKLNVNICTSVISQMY